MTTNAAIEPGWYLDPDDPSLCRWYDGTRYTDQTKASGIRQHTAAEWRADEDAWSLYPDRQERVAPSWDADTIAQADAREATSGRRRKLVTIGLAALALAFGPVAVIVIPLALVVLLVLWGIGRGDSVKVREALEHWGATYGVRYESGTVLAGDKAPAHELGTADEPLRALKAAGMRIRGEYGARLRGTPWRAGAGTMVQSFHGVQEHRRDVAVMTVVSVPLVPEVAERYAGLAVERPRVDRMFQLRAWEEWDSDQNVEVPVRREFLVMAHPDQSEDVGYWALSTSTEPWAHGLSGWVVAEGMLSVWCYGDLLTEVGQDQARVASGARIRHTLVGDMRLTRLLDQARNLQYQLYTNR